MVLDVLLGLLLQTFEVPVLEPLGDGEGLQGLDDLLFQFTDFYGSLGAIRLLALGAVIVFVEEVFRSRFDRSFPLAKRL